VVTIANSAGHLMALGLNPEGIRQSRGKFVKDHRFVPFFSTQPDSFPLFIFISLPFLSFTGSTLPCMKDFF